MSKYTQKIIYVLGNGFDIAAKLPTRYTDYMFLLDNWQKFYLPYEKSCTEQKKTEALKCPPEGRLTEETLTEYAKSGLLFNRSNIEKMNTIISKNGWVTYFRSCQYKETGWAGFEKEIKEAIAVIDKMMQPKVRMLFERMSTHEKAFYKMYQKMIYSRDTVGFGEAYKNESDEESVKAERRSFIDRAALELLDFTEAFRLYLIEFVERMITDFEPGIIKNEKTQVFVVSLNYTHSLFVKAGLENNCIHWIHGSDEILHNLVMGIDNDEHIGNEFIRFKKYFQRIQKKTGADYKKFFTPIPRGAGDNPIENRVIFFGHSIDPIDSDFIKDVFGLTESCFYIHYCSQGDYEQKVINCVEIFGSDYVIDAVANNKIIFTDKDLSEIPTLPYWIRYI